MGAIEEGCVAVRASTVRAGTMPGSLPVAVIASSIIRGALELFNSC